MRDESNRNNPPSATPLSKARTLFGAVLGALVVLVVAWFLFGGRISYAASECSKGVKQCVVGVAVALGIVDVYDKNDRCIGVGCNM